MTEVALEGAGMMKRLPSESELKAMNRGTTGDRYRTPTEYRSMGRWARAVLWFQARVTARLETFLISGEEGGEGRTENGAMHNDYKSFMCIKLSFQESRSKPARCLIWST